MRRGVRRSLTCALISGSLITSTTTTDASHPVPQPRANVAPALRLEERPEHVSRDFVRPPVTVPAYEAQQQAAAHWAATPEARRVKFCESSDDPHASNGTHFGLWQFDLSTWHDVGGTGDPRIASPAEQDYRAWLLWRARGWEPWQCAR